MFRHGYDLRELTVAACRSAGFEPDFAVEGGEMDAVLGFVRAGLGMAVVPRMVAARSGRGLRVTRWPGPACTGRSPWPTAATWLRRGRRGSCSGCCWSGEDRPGSVARSRRQASVAGLRTSSHQRPKLVDAVSGVLGSAAP